jgi:hypothetical protein
MTVASVAIVITLATSIYFVQSRQTSFAWVLLAYFDLGFAIAGGAAVGTSWSRYHHGLSRWKVYFASATIFAVASLALLIFVQSGR